MCGSNGNAEDNQHDDQATSGWNGGAIMKCDKPDASGCNGGARDEKHDAHDAVLVAEAWR